MDRELSTDSLDYYSTDIGDRCTVHAAQNGYLEVIYFLERHKSSLGLRMKYDNLLCAACSQGQLKAAKCLVEFGADIYCRQHNPLMISIINDHYHIIDWLLSLDYQVDLSHVTRSSDLDPNGKIRKWRKNYYRGRKKF